MRWFSSEKILIKLSASPYCVAKELRDITDGFLATDHVASYRGILTPPVSPADTVSSPLFIEFVA